MEPLKNLYSHSFLSVFSSQLSDVVPGLKTQKFLNDVFSADWPQLELKQRMRRIAAVLHSYLPGTYAEQVRAIISLIRKLRADGVKENSIEYMFLPDFVEQFGLQEPGVSLDAMEEITQFTSCEFAIRPFLLRDQAGTMQRMLAWSRHADHKVRRFSSEGCRPRLPWAMAIPALKKDPSPILPLLENLRNDPSEFVRRSVANNLNDIAKDHPDVVLQIIREWKGVSAETDWILKHGSRTLLKKAHPAALSAFDLNTSFNCTVDQLVIQNETLRINDTLSFSFNLVHQEAKETRFRIECAIYYVKAKGQRSRKLFKITENSYASDRVYSFSRSQSFRNMTTRTHYPGRHKLAVVVNGAELAACEFELLPG